MSHPDEGLIHTWLDGELDAAEAARVEALVQSDPAWAAAAAEARGFIAASSRIVGALDDVPAGVIPKASVGGSGSPAGGDTTVKRLRQAQRRTLPWWTMRVAALLVVATGTVLVVQRVTPDDTVSVGDQQAKQTAADLAAPAPQATAPAAAPVAAPVTGQLSPQVTPQVVVTSAEQAAAASARLSEMKDKRLNDAIIGTSAPLARNEADAAKRPAQGGGADARPAVPAQQLGALAQQQGIQTLQAPAAQTSQAAPPVRRDIAEVGKQQGVDEKRIIAADASRDAAAARGVASGTGGAATGSLKKEDLPASPKVSAPRAAAAAPPPDQFRQQAVNAVSREECYREGAPALDGVPVVHRVGRISDSTAMSGAALGFRAQANTVRARESSLSTTMRVRGDTLFIGIVNGVARIALRVNCPAP